MTIGKEVPMPKGDHSGGRKIRFRDVEMKYRPDIKDFVLNKLNFEIEPGHKVGIVGRTGAGKSTMAVCISRICELHSGSIEVDDVNIANINLHELRDNITVIPQEPVIFRDTIKFNLDPTGKTPDREMEELLE